MDVSLEESFGRLRAGVRATIGVAVAGPGGVRSFGDWTTGVAWSTIKVPLAIAAVRAEPALAGPLLTSVITESDNAASEALWRLLGPPVDAARHVRAVIEDAGDSETAVESRRLRDGFTPFGQTQWPLVRQAAFAARLPSVRGAGTVVELMHRVVAAQRWGLAARNFAAKGGWGPGLRGDYLVRQFGVVPTGSGDVGVALAAQAESFEAGVEIVGAIADWTADHLAEQ
ncbi:hypothetical protein [Mycobacterium sp. Marseille-P9652]|uniref:hypothetical protein n=1 Tax=Mycobacterium sp. Marseille-P9652 TaxID=2654950 RepID=UPI0012E95E25|nr:hypothetical protein [Mycobacterium sp. Marseille-P9652]